MVNLDAKKSNLVAASFTRSLEGIYLARAGDPGSVTPRAQLRVLAPDAPADEAALRRSVP